ncbi:MAG: nonstructural protein [Microvirus sp.]|nr:MAG: nonstructural protein [Microvirus sp.]
MSKMFLVAVRDHAMDAYANPIAVPSLGVAMRSFTDEINRADPQNQMHQHPEDFELWLVAEYSTELAVIRQDQDIPRRLARGKDVMTNQGN